MREEENEKTILFSLSSSFFLWFQLARDLANVLVTREVASVSVDFHLVQRAELLRVSSVRPSVRSSVRVPPGKSRCQVLRLIVFPFSALVLVRT